MLCFLTHNKKQNVSKFKEIKHVALGLPTPVFSPAPPAAAAPAPSPCRRNTFGFFAIGGPYESLADDWPDHCQFP